MSKGKNKKKARVCDDAACPFYRWDDGSRTITCEGIVDGSTLTQTYLRKADCALQLSVFCCDKYRNCEIHTMLQEKYADGW